MKKKKRHRQTKRAEASPPGPTISLSMIVRDEAQFLAGCLQSVEGVVEEIVVVDTGSQDDTVEIAESFGARVFHYAWDDDFAAARNRALAECTGDWVLSLDADEQLDPATKHEIRAAAAQTGVHTWYLRMVSMEGETPTGNEIRMIRLFRRTPGTRYAGRIHEQVVQDIPNKKWGDCNAIFRHYGYDPSIYKARRKKERYLRILELGLEDTRDGADPIRRGSYLYYRAMLADDDQRLDRLAELARFIEAQRHQLKGRIPWIPAGLIYYALALLDAGQPLKAAQTARGVLGESGEAPVLHAIIGAAHLAEGDLEQAEHELSLVLTTRPAVDRSHREYSLPAGLAQRMAKIVLGQLRERQDRLLEAEELYREFLPLAEDLRPRLAHVLAARQNYQEALETLDGSADSLRETPPETACVGFALSLIVQSGKGLLWWGEKVRLAAEADPLCADVLGRVQNWEVGRPFTADDFPEIAALQARPSAIH